jgi:Holliday junction DNA helicase RuvB
MIQQANCVPGVGSGTALERYEGPVLSSDERGPRSKEKALERDEKTVVLRYGLEQAALRRTLRTTRRNTDVGHRALAFYLNDLRERGVYKLWGYSSAVQYACRELEMRRRQARDLLAVGGALEELKRIDAAFADGRLSWTRVRILCRIATCETEAAWLERALKIPCQQLEWEVRGSEKGRPPRDDGKGLPALRLNVSFKGVDPACHELYEQARSYVRAEMGEEVSPGELLRRLCGSLLTLARRGEKTEVDPGLYRVVIDSFNDGSFAVRSEEGSIPLEREVACRLAADPRVPKVQATPEEENTPLPRGRDKPIPAAMRQQVLARDGFRCVHCQRKVGLQGHHVIWLSHGGRTSPENLATLCRVCHGLIHDGYLRVSGTAPHKLKFTARDGLPLGATDPAEIGIRVVTEPPKGGAQAPPTPSSDLSNGTQAPGTADSGVSGGAYAPPVQQVGVADLPTGLAEPSWWARHAHLFPYNERRRVLEFRPGFSREVPAKAPSPAGSSDASSPRPASLDAIVGQSQAIETLRLALEGARARHEPLDHVLLEGSPGLGKTSIAAALAREMDGPFQATSGPLLKDVSVLCCLLTSAAEGEVLFIDEIHRLPPEVAEVLYEAMEDGTLSVPVLCAAEVKTLRLKLRRLTVIGATTDPDRLPRPLRARFGVQLVLESYGEAELIEILEAAAARQDLDIDTAAAATLARAALGTPRRALSLFRRAADACLARTRHLVDDSSEQMATMRHPEGLESEVARTRHRITTEDVQRALAALGLDARGLEPRQRRALEILRSREGRPLGVARLAARIDVTRRVWCSLLEPALLRLGLITTTPRGVVLVT